MNYIRCISLALLFLLTSLSALDAQLFSDDKNSSVTVYSIPQSELFRQITLKGNSVNLTVIGDSRNKVEVVLFSQERGKNSSANAEAYFNSYRKGQIALKEVKDGNKSSIQSKFYRLNTVDKGKELVFDYKSEQNNKYSNYALLLLPANYAAQLDIAAGSVGVESMASEIMINTSSGSVDLSNSRGVAGLKCKSGNLSITNFQGVINASLLSGNMDVEKSEGDLSIKMVSGNCDIKDFLGKVRVDNTVGDLQMNRIRKSDIAVKNISGNLDFDNLQDCGIVKISNESGEIAINSSRMRKLLIQAGGGDIDLNKVDAVFRISSRAGDISLSTENLQLNEDNLIELDYGDIELNLKDRGDYDYFKNPSGDRKYNANKSIDADSYLRIRNQNGQGKQFFINVDTGSISVE